MLGMKGSRDFTHATWSCDLEQRETFRPDYVIFDYQLPQQCQDEDILEVLQILQDMWDPHAMGVGWTSLIAHEHLGAF